MYHDLFNKLTAPDSNNKDEYKSSKIPNTNHIIGKNFDKTSTFNARNKDAQNNNIKLSLMTVT